MSKLALVLMVVVVQTMVSLGEFVDEADISDDARKNNFPKFCRKIMRPVCGSNGKTYNNKCELRMRACKIKMRLTVACKGRCKEPRKSTLDCLKLCPKIMRPVCGSDGKTYNNKCELKMRACKIKMRLTVAYKGCCKEKCPRIMKKVCGSDGKTYNNECLLRAQACKGKLPLTLAYQGPCRAKCPKFCPMIMKKVCGSDGKTYNNECLLRARACKIKMRLTLAHQGPCRGTKD